MERAHQAVFQERAVRRSLGAALVVLACGACVGAAGCVTRARGERSDLLESPRLVDAAPTDASVTIGADATPATDDGSADAPPTEASAGAGAPAQSEAAPPDPAGSAVASERATPAQPEAARGDERRVRVDLGPPATGRAASKTGAPVARAPVDAMIGQINGVPLFASDILGPMDARLRAEAEKMARDEFLVFAREQIRRALRDRLRDELLLAEARSSLTPEQRVGLRFFVQSLREDLVRGALGSEELAERRLQEREEGLTLEEEVERRRDRELILLQLRKILRRQMQISWRDIRQEYERQMAQRADRPVARFRLIWIDAEDEEAARRVETALDEDVPFDEIAAVENVRDAGDAGLIERELDGATYGESRLFGPDPLNEHAMELEPGGVVGPFEFLDYRIWMKLEAVERPDTSLYQAQIPIRDALRRRRMAEAEAQYFQDLINESSLTDISEMERRLLELVRDRYLAPS